LGHTKSGFEIKNSKKLFFFWLGGLDKTMFQIYEFIFPNSPQMDLGLNQDLTFHFAGVSHLFIFPEHALIMPFPNLQHTIMCWELQNFCQITNRKTSKTPFNKITFAVDAIIYKLAP